MTAGIDLALHMVDQYCGHSCSGAVTRAMVVYLGRTDGDTQFSPWLVARNHLHPAVHRMQNAVLKDPLQN